MHGYCLVCCFDLKILVIWDTLRVTLFHLQLILTFPYLVGSVEYTQYISTPEMALKVGYYHFFRLYLSSRLKLTR